MLALTLYEPWASLVACGAKSIETRSWSTNYRGPLAIHASKKLTGDALDYAMWTPAVGAALTRAGRPLPETYPKVKDAFRDTRGHVIAIVTLTRCIPIFDVGRTRRLWSAGQGELALTDTELQFGDYSDGRYGWVLTDVRRLDPPIPASGALGLWEWKPPAGVLEAA